VCNMGRWAFATAPDPVYGCQTGTKCPKTFFLTFFNIFFNPLECQIGSSVTYWFQ
jgi:hypothetical protein